MLFSVEYCQGGKCKCREDIKAKWVQSVYQIPWEGVWTGNMPPPKILILILLLFFFFWRGGGGGGGEGR